MSGTNVNASQGLGVQNNNVPPEGPKSIPVTLPLATQNPCTVNLTQAMYLGQISMIQSAFIDNSANASALSVYVPVTQQNIVIPPLSQAYIPLLSPNPPVFVFTSTGGINIQIQINNFSMPLQIWAVGGSGNSNRYDGAGNLYTHDYYLDALISGGALKVLNYLDGDNDTVVPYFGAGRAYSGSLAAASTSVNMITSATGLFVTGAAIYLDPVAYKSAPGPITFSITCGSDTFWQRTVYLNSSAASGSVTFPQLGQALLDKSDLNWLSRSSGSPLVLNSSGAYIGSGILWSLIGGVTATIGT